MATLKVPKSFYLHGKRYTVRIVRKGHWEDYEHVGALDSIKCVMTLMDGPQQFKEQTYLHEIVHGILRHMGKDQLDDDENFVDIFASLLHQALTSAR